MKLKPTTRKTTEQQQAASQNLYNLSAATTAAVKAIAKAAKAVEEARYANTVLLAMEAEAKKTGYKPPQSERTLGWQLVIHNFRSAIEACKPRNDGTVGCCLTWAGFRQH